MSKIFILRKNSLLSSADSTLRFGSDNEIVIPMVVIDELQCYNGKPEKRKISDQILGYIESFDIRKLTREGVIQANGSKLRISSEKPDTNQTYPDGITDIDKKIFEVCFATMEKNPEKKVILVSKNAAIRIKARSIGIQAENFRDDLFPSPNEQYTGRKQIQASRDSINRFFKQEFMPINEVYEAEKIEWVENMFLEIKAYDSDYYLAIGRYDGEKIVPLVFKGNNYPYGIMAKNAGQQMLLECLLTDWKKAPLVIVKGGAGTGKTYCSLAYALSQLEDFQSRILVATPSETVGNERLGFLPGDIRDKFSPYLGGIKDNLSIIINGKNNNKKGEMRENGEYYFETGLIQVQPIGFLRGRTIVNSIFIIDETQNIDPGEIKSIVTRAAEGSKFIFLGDPTQVDNPKLNERYNGLVYLSEKMKGNPLCWQITLENEESVRGELSKIASKLL